MVNQSREPNPRRAPAIFPVNRRSPPWDRTSRHLGRLYMASTCWGRATVSQIEAYHSAPVI